MKAHFEFVFEFDFQNIFLFEELVLSTQKGTSYVITNQDLYIYIQYTPSNKLTIDIDIPEKKENKILVCPA